MLLKSLLDLVFPPACEVCRRRSEETLCPACFSQIKFMKPQMGIYHASIYDGVMRAALHRFKFKKKKRLAEPLGVTLVKYLSHADSLPMRELDAIVPVPLHPLRQRQRGFNQTELLAQVVGRYFELPVVPALARVRNTHPQFDLPREARFINLKGAFKVAMPDQVYGRRLLLLDDIYTTGSTVGECSRALKIAGAARVEILTLSRAVEV